MALEDHQQPEAEKRIQNGATDQSGVRRAQNNLGILYNQQEKPPKRLPCFNAPSENDPKYSRAYVNLGLTLARKWATTLGAETKFSVRHPHRPPKMRVLTPLLACCRQRLVVVLTQPLAFARPVDLQPDSSDAHLNLGIALVDQYDARARSRNFRTRYASTPTPRRPTTTLAVIITRLARATMPARNSHAACRLQPDFRAGLYFLALLNNRITRSSIRLNF